jgi:hypothetical protein
VSAAALLQLDVWDECRAGHGSAVCIPWDSARDAKRAISECRVAFEAAGWIWNSTAEQLERDGWLAWFRSQGHLASPIIQWSRLEYDIEETAEDLELSPSQYTLF